MEAVERDGARLLRCTECGHRFGGCEDDPRRGAVLQGLALDTGMPDDVDCDPSYRLRQYSCPGCGTAIAVDVQRGAEPVLGGDDLGPHLGASQRG